MCSKGIYNTKQTSHQIVLNLLFPGCKYSYVIIRIIHLFCGCIGLVYFQEEGTNVSECNSI